MSIANLFISSNNAVGGLRFDGWLTEKHSNEVVVTTNPVELGADIADHAIIQPVKLDIEVMVTDSPLGLQAINAAVGQVAQLFGASTAEGGTRSAQAYIELLKIMHNRQPIDVQTNLKLYSNMVITSVSPPVDKYKALVIPIQLVEVIIVDSLVVPYIPENLEEGKVTQQASSPSVEGRREVKEVPEGSNVERSTLKSAVVFTRGS